MAENQPAEVPETVQKHSPLKIVLLALVVIIVGLVAVVAMQPNEFHVERKATIAAPASAVFEQVNDFHHWENWSPWAKIDPNMKTKYEGPASGEGASYAWEGNREVGEGQMTIVESRPHELIKIKLEFKKPFAGTNASQFAFQPEGEQTVVTWSMDGQKNFITKAFGLLMSMDKMIGDRFEKGLKDLDAVASAHQQPAQAGEPKNE